jgi:hypothetical protein
MTAKPGNQLRALLFGELLDLPALQAAPTETRHLLANIDNDLARGDKQAALRTLETIGLRRDLESLYRIHAWRLLRQAGGSPTASVKNDVLGVVVEVGVEKGDDILATYHDRTARYYNYSGAGVVWLRPDSSLDGLLDNVLAAANAILPHIGPWESVRRPPPTAGHMRLNILTPVGLHFGEAPMEALARDRLAGPLFDAANRLMGKLTSLPDTSSR